MKGKTKEIVVISMLIAMCCILSYIDTQLSRLIIIAIPVLANIYPYFKIGFANIVILYMLYKYKTGSIVVAIFLKNILTGLIYGNYMMFLIGLAASFVSFVVMLIFKKIFNGSYIILISVLGGIFHILTQTIVVFMFYGIATKDYGYLIYLPIMLAIGAFSGAIIGLIAKKILNIFDGRDSFE